MELEHSFTVPVPAEQAWQALLDVEQVAPCMPGATVESVEGDVISGRIKVKVGPVTLTYSGKAQFTERDDAAHVITLKATGKETRGSGTASATVRSSLLDEGGQTRVVVTTTLSVTGRPAQFGRGVMAEVGGKIIERFAANLAEQLTGGEAETAVEADGAGPGVEPAPAPAAGPPPSAPAPSPEIEAVRSLPIDDLQLPARVYNSLRREGVLTIGNLCDSTEVRLRAIEHVGPQAIIEIQQKLAARGLSLTEEAPLAAAGEGESVPAGAIPEGEAVPAGAGQPAAPASAAARVGLAPAGPTAAPPRAPRPPDEEAIDLLSVAGFPLLKRALPVAGGLLALLLVVLRLRHRRRAGRS